MSIGELTRLSRTNGLIQLVRLAAIFCTAIAMSSAIANEEYCYTVRGPGGDIVYQSLRPPVDISRPYSDVIQAKYPGGYMEASKIWARCGSVDRYAQSANRSNLSTQAARIFDCKSNSSTELIPECLGKRTPLKTIDTPLQTRQATPDDSPGGIFAGLTQERGAVVNPNPSVEELAKFGDFAKFVPKKQGYLDDMPEFKPATTTKALADAPSPSSKDTEEPLGWLVIAVAWGVIGLLAIAIFTGTTRVNDGAVKLSSVLVGALRTLRILLGLLLIVQVWTFVEGFSFAIKNPAVLQRLEFIVPVLIKLACTAVFVLLFDYFRRVINRLHVRKFGIPHPSLTDRWSL